ncbi:MAG: DNA primase [Pirellulales bacterium]|nr:DNA primase [Pirellulales bacterium]
MTQGGVGLCRWFCRQLEILLSNILAEPGVAGPVPFDAKDELRRAIDIVDLVGSYIQLRRSGRNYVGLCPWHDDRRPSLQVNPERQTFKCWVCDLGGDIFSFVMQAEKVSFPEAMQLLADRAGISLRPTPRGGLSASGESAGASADPKAELYRAMAWAVEQYSNNLQTSPQADVAREYLADRGITTESVRKFRLGFAPDRWDWLLERARAAQISAKTLETVGLVTRGERAGSVYDRFRGRVLFAINDTQGRPVALGGRILPSLAETSPAKYINSPETPLFSKSSLLYALDTAKEALRQAEAKRVLVVEGYTDVVIAHQSGFRNTVAVLGTALGEKHVRLLRRYADQIILVLDGDEAGQRRTNEVLELFVAEQVDLRVLTLPDKLDPCDFLLARGADAFNHLLDTAIDALGHLVRQATTGVAHGDMHAANQAIEQVLGVLAKAPRLREDTPTSARVREHQVLHQLSRQFGVPEELLRGRLSQLRRSAARKPSAPQVAPATPLELPRLDSWEQELLELLVEDPSWVAEALTVLGVEQLPSAIARQIVEACRDLHEIEGEATFERLLGHFDEPELKAFLVDLDERGRAKASATREERRACLLEGWRRRHEQLARRLQVDAVRQRHVGDDEALALLARVVEQERNRHCMTEPTEG